MYRPDPHPKASEEQGTCPRSLTLRGSFWCHPPCRFLPCVRPIAARKQQVTSSHFEGRDSSRFQRLPHINFAPAGTLRATNIHLQFPFGNSISAGGVGSHGLDFGGLSMFHKQFPPNLLGPRDRPEPNRNLRCRRGSLQLFAVPV